ncbi:hypothetical protein EJ02DRAFT_266793 [Clathrospora elynae]|uniref:Uncharacterized protein n=1 Tax=Clathrospora elynae TaxID=706981 RepID=A0A6A5SEH1_9PLEO|nr:hypothetical protein EJ02DRAFT_266793 [Clathrospora elynae]
MAPTNIPPGNNFLHRSRREAATPPPFYFHPHNRRALALLITRACLRFIAPASHHIMTLPAQLLYNSHRAMPSTSTLNADAPAFLPIQKAHSIRSDDSSSASSSPLHSPFSFPSSHPFSSASSSPPKSSAAQQFFEEQKYLKKHPHDFSFPYPSFFGGYQPSSMPPLPLQRQLPVFSGQAPPPMDPYATQFREVNELRASLVNYNTHHDNHHNDIGALSYGGAAKHDAGVRFPKKKMRRSQRHRREKKAESWGVDEEGGGGDGGLGS